MRLHGTFCLNTSFSSLCLDDDFFHMAVTAIPGTPNRVIDQVAARSDVDGNQQRRHNRNYRYQYLLCFGRLSNLDIKWSRL